jgi:hypothetical protein
MAAIHLGPRLLEASSDQPEGGPGRPLPSYLVLLRAGFTQSFRPPKVAEGSFLRRTGRSPGRWCALTAPFHPYPSGFNRLKQEERSVSVALSVASPRLGVTQHPALWSSDFPPSFRKKESGRPSS